CEGKLMDRRDFIRSTIGGTALSVSLGTAGFPASSFSRSAYSENITIENQQGMFDLSMIPNFCSHEHWGSIDSIGMVKEGYRADVEAGATPSRQTSIWDIVLDPYLTGFIKASGIDFNALAKNAGKQDFLSWWKQDPKKTLEIAKSHLEHQMLTGTFQCIRKGILFLHGIDIASFAVNDWIAADEAVTGSYSDIFSWYDKAMKKAHFSGLIRPVHPEFFFRKQDEGSAANELSFTHTIMRIDPLLTFWRKDNPRRDQLAAIIGIEPHDAVTWRTFINRLFDIAVQHKSVGIKQLQAYSRSLDFVPRADSEVVWNGELNPEQVIIFQDWVVHECCKQAHERKLPHQVHVGTNNIANSSPLPLEKLARRYPDMKIVMIHCWPFLEEAGYLAKQVPNIYIDTCWMPVLNPSFLKQSFHRWINYVPYHKIMCAHDSTSIEMAAGSSLFTREILSGTLAMQMESLSLNSTHATQIAKDMLHNDAVHVYGIGAEI
ncbi:MAG: amidohydrolase family protein, partial [Patescibacteria group bacterium]|nr:amidohydrolase family protein [Patescibacteria group bacterium]